MRQFGTKRINSRNLTISNSFSVSRRLRGEMNSHGKAGECGSLAVYRNYVAGVCRAGDGVFGVGGDGAGAVWIAICLLVEAVGLGGGGVGGDGGGDAGGLPPLQESGAGIFVVGDYNAVAHFCLFPGPDAQYASVDTRRRIFLSALGTGEASPDFISRVFSGRPREYDG